MIIGAIIIFVVAMVPVIYRINKRLTNLENRLKELEKNNE